MDQTLQGKVAIITGGGTGIGLATAQSLVARGAFAYLTGLDAAQLDQAAAKLDGRASGLAADVTSKAEMEAVAERIRAEKGKVDIVFANVFAGDLSA